MSTQDIQGLQVENEQAATEILDDSTTQAESASSEANAEATPESTGETLRSETGPYEFPAEIHPAEPAPQLDPELQQLRERNQYLESQATRIAQYEQAQKRQDSSRSIEEAYIQQGWDEGTAKVFAQGIMAERARGEAQAQSIQQQTDYRTNQRLAAEHYAKEYNVRPESLLNFPTEESMRQHAQFLGWAGKELASLKEDVQRLQGAKVPEQDFAGGGLSGTSSPEQLLAYYGANPDVDISANHMKMLRDAGY